MTIDKSDYIGEIYSIKEYAIKLDENNWKNSQVRNGIGFRSFQPDEIPNFESVREETQRGYHSSGFESLIAHLVKNYTNSNKPILNLSQTEISISLDKSVIVKSPIGLQPLAILARELSQKYS